MIFNDKKYREMARIAIDLREYLISVETTEYYKTVRHSTWLHLIGLMETQDIVE